jgi:hypothetical protein
VVPLLGRGGGTNKRSWGQIRVFLVPRTLLLPPKSIKLARILDIHPPEYYPRRILRRSDLSSFDDEEIISKLKGNTLRAYWAILSTNDGLIGVRELQRQLGFSSPALAAYHLNKLVDFKLVINDRGDYRLIKEVKVGILKQYIKLGTFLFPRYVLYATMFTTLLLFLLTRLDELTFYSVYALLVSLISAVIAWYEAIRIWEQRP